MTQIIIEIFAAAVPFAGGLWAIARWTAKVDKNTEATEKLTAAYDTFTEKISTKVTDLDVRVTLLERSKR
jgi:hypothetical protein